MTRNDQNEYWVIVWRDRITGNIVYTGLTEYTSWPEADLALSTLWSQARTLTATIERQLRGAARRLPKIIRLSTLFRLLDEGAIVRFNWNTCERACILPTGEILVLDGRIYHPFQASYQNRYERTETGTVEDKNLVIEWRKR